MIKRKKCIVDDCDYPRWAKGYCKAHQSLRTDKKKPKPLKQEKKNYGEKLVFEMIWNERDHVSFISGIHLGDEAKAHFFAHVIAKGKEPKLRLVKENIVLLSIEEHSLLDAGTQEQRDKYAEIMKQGGVPVDWSKIDKRKEKLKKKYKL